MGDSYKLPFGIYEQVLSFGIFIISLYSSQSERRGFRGNRNIEDNEPETFLKRAYEAARRLVS